MDDQDLEVRLQSYRPAGPPVALRARIVPARNPSALAWLPAAAALVLTMLFYWLAAKDRERLFAQFPVVNAEETIEVPVETQP